MAMLVLTRTANEGVWIGNEVRVVVLGVRNGQVRLGFDAPPKVRIDRDEIAERRVDRD